MNYNELTMDIMTYARGYSFVSTWQCVSEYKIKNKIEKSRKEIFLDILRILIDSNKIKLISNSVFIEKHTNELVALFDQNWPDYYDENDPLHDIDNLWWNCYAPAGVVWIYDNGKLGLT
ncbi:DUF596 domain-containing protein [Testudinibacter sp. P27/CKL/0425]